MRSSRTSEKPMTALSGVRSSCDMLARNSDLCRLLGELGALPLQLAVYAGVGQGDGRLVGEGLQQLARLLAELPRDLATHHEGAHGLPGPDVGRGSGDHGTPAGGITGWRGAESGSPRWSTRSATWIGLPSRQGRLSDEGLVDVNPAPRSAPRTLGARAGGRANAEEAGVRSSRSTSEPPLVPGELDRNV